MTLLIVLPGREEEADRLAADLRAVDGGIEVRVWPDVGDPEHVEMVVASRHPRGILGLFPNLRLVASFGAGVEHLVGDPDLSEGVAVVRTVDPALANGMAEYVVTAVANWRRGTKVYSHDQDLGRWRPQIYGLSTTVVVLGMGRMGSAVARALGAVGHQVIGWTMTGRLVEGVECIAGRSALNGVLPVADVLVCLLPLTPDTEDILDRELFSSMKKGSLVINVGRGAHLVEDDLIEALAIGRPGHAVLDVFREEALPTDHLFWTHPAITITPHVAALTDPRGASERIAENWRRLHAGEALLDRVDRGRGY
ncbi:MAG: glyoxylate/hydroxypyruvate reductase A [Acidobacteria bacterium]|nr:glyoxylate/hydroxypyruvate reductase A [Acidobacteriota bacterium]